MSVPVKARRKYRQAACLIAFAAYCAMLSSCHMFRHKEKQPLYYSAVETPPLEIPAGLDRPASASALVIVTPLAPLPQKEMKIVPPRISSQSTNDKTSSQIHWSAEGAYLLVQDTQKSVYRRLGVVIKRSGMLLSDTNMANGYRFEYSHDPKEPHRGFFSRLAFWRHGGPNYSGSYRAVIEGEGENSRIFIKNADGSDADPDAAEHLLNIFSERLG